MLPTSQLLAAATLGAMQRRDPRLADGQVDLLPSDHRSNVVPLRRPAPTEPTPNQPDGAALRQSLGQALRDERIRQERTLAEVASAAAVSLPYLSEIERGRKEASSDVLVAVTRALGIEVADLLERSAGRLRTRTRMPRHGSNIQLRAA